MKWISCALLFLSTLCLDAASITLGWDPNSETNLTAYKVFVGHASRSYFTNYPAATNTVIIDGRRTVTYTVTDIAVGRWYYYAVTAVTEEGLESDYSNEIKHGYRPAAPMMLKITGATNQQAAIWVSNTTESITVQYSPDLELWRDWAQIRTLDSLAPVGDAIFLSGIAPDDARFWRAVDDVPLAGAPPSLPALSLPAGLRLVPRYPPVPSVAP